MAVSAFFALNGGAQDKGKGELDQWIRGMIGKMTLEEKIAMLHAKGQFTSAGVPRLGIPELQSDDGPLGVREEVNLDWSPKGLSTDSATFFPNGAALAATWNPSLAFRYGSALGEESCARGKAVILAPAFNIARTPLNGRTYEYFSEDPFLNAELAVQSVRGIQQWHVAACIKHYALNNQETQRKFVNVTASERALREIYLPAFRAAVVRGGAWTVMTAYNKFRGTYCAENAYLLNTILKKEWGFKGAVISDWGGTHSTVASALNGLDIEMGTGKPYNQYYFADSLLAAVKNGQVSSAAIDDKIYRILWVMRKTVLAKDSTRAALNTASHIRTSYDIASEAIVLLKNDAGLLPLKLSKVKSIAVIGENAVRTFQKGGVGAGVKAKHEITILQGLKEALGKNVSIRYAAGYKGYYRKDDPVDKKIAGHRPLPELIAEAVKLAKEADLVVLCIGGNRDYETEGEDRANLDLPFGEQQLADAVTGVNRNTIVVFTGGAPYNLNKLHAESPAIVWNWYNGSEGGHAVADILTGKVNPSGKLPFSFPVALEHSPAHALHSFPGDSLEAPYKEDILVGYRWYDTKGIASLYPFGYGLSYTRFAFEGLKLSGKDFRPGDTVTVTFRLKNKGSLKGKEVVQLYVSKENSAVSRPLKELKGFGKPELAAGDARTIRMSLPVASLAFFNEKTMQWEVEEGRYTVRVGSSSAELPLEGSFFVHNRK